MGVGDEAEILIKIIESNNMRSRYKRTDRIQHNISIGIEETKQMKHKVDVERKEKNGKHILLLITKLLEKESFSNLCRKTNIYKNDVFFFILGDWRQNVSKLNVLYIKPNNGVGLLIYEHFLQYWVDVSVR